VLKVGLQTGGGSQTGSATTDDRSWPESFVPPTPAELAPLFPELEILELVGRGGMGVVYKARQKRLDRFVALKILSPKIGQDPAFAKRFLREARAMAMLNHAHIVAVHDFGQTASSLAPSGKEAAGEGTANLSSPSGKGAGAEGGLYYFLMEFVDGLNVRRLLDAGKLAPEEALAIVPQICEALQYAHDHGVVHRDIKPENVLIDKEGQVKIADFGIAKLVGREAKDLTLTGAGQIVGTPQYMAPEQIEHPLQVDHRADIYSLGVVFYQMLTGELPIGRFAAPSKKVQIDVRLDDVVLRALEKEPELRYQHASEVKSEVDTIRTTPGKRSEKGPPGAPPAAVPKSPQMADLVAMLGGLTFTSSLARTLANASALGFLGALAFLAFIPLPGMQRCLGFSGFAGFFGLIGVAYLVEFAHRGKTKSAVGEARDADDSRLRQETVPRISAYGVRGAVWAALAVSYAAVRILLGPPWQVQGGVDALVLILSVAALPGVPILGATALAEIRRSQGQVRGLGWALFDLLFTPLLLLNALIGFELCWTWTSISAALKVDQLNRVSFWIPTLLLSVMLDFPIARWVSRAVTRQAHRGRANSFTRGERMAVRATVVASCLLCAITFAVVSNPERKTNQGPTEPHRAPPNAEVTTGQRAIDGATNSPEWPFATELRRPLSLAYAEQQLASARLLNHIQPLDLLEIHVIRTPQEAPIDGKYLVEPDGNVAIGPHYGRAKVDGLTLEQAEGKITQQLKKTLWDPSVQVTLAGRLTQWRRAEFTKLPFTISPGNVLQMRVLGVPPEQPLDNDYLVEAGGTLPLGPAYGRVKVSGLGLEAAEKAVQEKLKEVLREPQVQISLPVINSPDLPGIHWQEAPLPKPPYTIKPGDLLSVSAIGMPPEAPVQDVVLVEPAGTVPLGPAYGRTRVEGLSLEAAEQAIKKKLQEIVAQPEVSVTLAGWSDVPSAFGPATPNNTYLPTGRVVPLVPPSVPYPPAKADPQQSSRAAEMRTILLAGLEYAIDHSAWPKSLDDLKPKYLDPAKIDLGQFVYYPLSEESLKKNPRETAVLAEKEPAFAGGQLVGFADGYVDFAPNPEFLLVPAETKATSISDGKKEEIK